MQRRSLVSINSIDYQTNLDKNYSKTKYLKEKEYKKILFCQDELW